ncbi:DUF2306 domain-containing protein [Spongiactinospora sp. 9N601]|uniref:DUF2306 domain-containing protein n=1 Tax=Spongiactinospora sp. 9N601 TaxID=3375149 RepID=UPI003798B723
MTTTSLSRTARRRWWWALWGLMAVLAVGIAAYAVPPYLTGDPADSALPLRPDVALHYLSLVVHAVPGGLVLIIGPLQFMTRLRVSNPKVHRVLGRIYMISIVAGSIAAIVAATYSLDGFPSQVAFYLLTAAWLYTVGKAYQAIRRGEVQLHRIWMIRNYALTFAAVTLRIYLIIGMAVRASVPELAFEDVYTTSVWASILINAVVAEYFIIHRTLMPLARRRQRHDSAPAAQNIEEDAAPIHAEKKG